VHSYSRINQNDRVSLIQDSGLSDLQNDLQILKLVYGDSRRIIQIIYNFLSNAIKFSNQNGTVSVKVTLTEEQDIVSEVAQKALKSVIDANISLEKDKELALIKIQEDNQI
jgi:signal transduction histidine kinase